MILCMHLDTVASREDREAWRWKWDTHVKIKCASNKFLSFFLFLNLHKGVHQIVLSDTVVGNVASMDQPRPNEG
jgi:hypothetical protein